MDNIVEGLCRSSRNEFIQFLTIARGSVAEVQSQLYICLDRKYISQEVFTIHFNIADEAARMLTTFISYLNKNKFQGNKFKDRTKSFNNSKPQTPN